MTGKKFMCTLMVLMLGTFLVTPALASGSKMEVAYDLPAGVEVTAVDTEFEVHEILSPEKPCLYIVLSIKNTSDSDGRYQVYVTLPVENKSAGGVMPRTGDPLAPGAEVSGKYPFQLYEVPRQVKITVEKIQS